MSKDILLYETGNGGDMLISNNDIALVEILYQQVYLSLFGGNIEASTKGNELPTEIRQDWWGNSLQFREKKEKQFNSQTERILNTTAMNSAGRIEVIRTVQDDLKFLKNISDIQINVIILGLNKLKITILLKSPSNKENKILQIIWDDARLEVVIDKQI